MPEEMREEDWKENFKKEADLRKEIWALAHAFGLDEKLKAILKRRYGRRYLGYLPIDMLEQLLCDLEDMIEGITNTYEDMMVPVF